MGVLVDRMVVVADVEQDDVGLGEVGSPEGGGPEAVELIDEGAVSEHLDELAATAQPQRD